MSVQVKISGSNNSSGEPSVRLSHITTRDLVTHFPEVGKALFAERNMREQVVSHKDPLLLASLVELRSSLRGYVPDEMALSALDQSGYPLKTPIPKSAIQQMAHDLKGVIDHAVGEGKDILVRFWF